MPLVRLLATGAGRYEVKQGELFICTDEEFARWAPFDVVELAEASDVVEVPEVEVSEGERVAAIAAGKEPLVVASASRSRRTTKK